MKVYNFDEIIERRSTNSLKHGFPTEHGYPEDVIPMWVADMDFRAPEPVLEALHRAVDHGIFGYSESRPEYYEAVASWFSRRFGWQTKAEWLVKSPGVVFALSVAVKSLTNRGDSVLIQPPVYRPFYQVITETGRQLVENPLRYENGRYQIDFADFERKIVEQEVKLFILCSPHNPVGRVWTREELCKMGRICRAHGVLVVSDEIHCDFAFPEHPHTIFLEANPESMEQAVVCTAPSKTFNLAGLQTSNIWIPNQELRKKFCYGLAYTGYSELNTLGLTACQAAYESGEEWLEQCKAYLRENLNYLRDFLQEHLPQIRLVEPQGTYFAWIDCSGLGMTRDELNEMMIHKAKLWLDEGDIFGACAAQFQRIVLACPRATLERALKQLEQAVNGAV